MGLKQFSGLIALTFLVNISYAQKLVVIHGRICDNTGKGIGYAAIQNTNTAQGINSDARGFFILKTRLPISLEAFALGYNTGKKEIEKSDKDTVELNFTLEENAAELRPVTISANHLPQLLEEHPSLMDFELKNNKLWLVYSVKGGDKIEVVDTGGKHITQTVFKYRFHKDSINQTPHGFLYSIYKDSLQLYTIDSNKIHVASISLQTYKEHSGDLVAFRNPYYYLIAYSDEDSHIYYICYDKSTGAKKIFYEYRDTRLLRANVEEKETLLALQALAPAENAPNGNASITNRNDTLTNFLGFQPDDQTVLQLLKDMNASYGMNTAMAENALYDAKNLINSHSPDPYAVDDEANALTMLHKKVFSILKIINDSVYVFNFQDNMINVYSPTNSFIRQEPFGINLHAIRFRKKEILVDETTQECYFKYKNMLNRTYLEKINLATGRVSYKIELKFPFIDKVRISGGYAYFSYFNIQDRDNIYNGKTCLYKQKLD